MIGKGSLLSEGWRFAKVEGEAGKLYGNFIQDLQGNLGLKLYAKI